jgi:outer membrane protein TolC
MPLIDWGKERRKLRLAKDKEERAIIQFKRDQMSFERSIFLQVAKYNVQDELFVLAAKTDSLSLQRYNISKQRFIIGKINAEMLNDALKEKDSAKKGYMTILGNYWSYYYSLRQLALYDFVNRQPLMVEYKDYLQP